MTTEHDELPQPLPGEHPFAPYVRVLGRGRHGSRSLSRIEARHAMGMILREEVDPVQLGAFLMLMRVKEESPDELTGFIEAVRDQAGPPPGLSVDIDWSSYAGKRRHAPWFFFSVLLLADAGFRIFIHGAEGHTPSRTYLTGVMADFGFETANDWSSVSRQLDQRGFSYLPLSCFASRLADLIELRPILGLRSPVHSLSRLINPLAAPLVMQGIFHRSYSSLHQAAGENLRYPRVTVIRGEGGEIERAPDKPLQVYRAWSDDTGSGTDEERWPAFSERGQSVPESIRTEEMLGVWRGEKQDEYGEAALITTAALALYEAGRCQSQTGALELAGSLWAHRDRRRFDSAPVAA